LTGRQSRTVRASPSRTGSAAGTAQSPGTRQLPCSWRHVKITLNTVELIVSVPQNKRVYVNKCVNFGLLIQVTRLIERLHDSLK
jgi:hypothetical protein